MINGMFIGAIISAIIVLFANTPFEDREGTHMIRGIIRITFGFILMVSLGGLIGNIL